ncbi:NYN domain-containing protein [Streptomyces carminius]|uniref:NYN domain-containing protein n=1 Tax=Streptomyces carminius TaxID=2665496 RepID=A0A2M8LPC4_9ACTN|nr:NYN domain-containing protein [Streptomyces carminius]
MRRHSERNLGEQVAVFVDFENLVLGAESEISGRTNPVPYKALTHLCRDYGNASIRRAYADWANPRFGRYQQDLGMNGVDLVQVARFGTNSKNAADVRMAVDAMETLIAHPDVTVFVLVAGDGDYTPLVQRLREYGKWVVGVGTDASASRRLVSVCSEYKYWGTLVAEVDPGARAARDAAFDIEAAESLLVSAMQQATTATPTAASVKNRMLALDPSFDERNYGCPSFRDFLTRLSHRVRTTGASGGDITLELI